MTNIANNPTPTTGPPGTGQPPCNPDVGFGFGFDDLYELDVL